jgi:hypothetical protein
MDPVKTSLPRIQLDALPPAARSILQKLEQSGLFRALVIESKGQQVLLDTAFGQLKGQSPQPLGKGDQILARIVQEQDLPTIKIEQVQLRQPVVTDKVLKQLVKLVVENPQNPAASASQKPALASNLPQIIKVLSQQNQQTQVLMGQKTYSIPQQQQLKPGDTLMLKLNERQQAEITRIDPQRVLQKALGELLPRLNTASDRTPALASLQKLVSSILKLKPADIVQPEKTLQKIQSAVAGTRAAPSPAGYNRQPTHIGNGITPTRVSSTLASTTVQSSIQAKPTGAEPPAKLAEPTAAITRPSHTAKPSTTGSQRAIEHLLQQLATPLASAGRIDASAVRQILTRLTLLPATLNPSSAPVQQSIPQQIQLLQQFLNQSPQAFRDMVQQVLHSQTSASNTTSVDDLRLQEMSSLLRNELQQQLEQTSTQLLVQKSTLKLNQELQQPIQINLNIPLQFKEDNIQLKLKLKQRQQNEQPDTQQWEIDLNFDLPLLGLISTHLLLQNSTLSASFWAVRDSTKQLIDSHLNQFKQQLTKSGFELGMFHSYLGEPAKKIDQDAPPALQQNLLDVKA